MVVWLGRSTSYLGSKDRISSKDLLGFAIFRREILDVRTCPSDCIIQTGFESLRLFEVMSINVLRQVVGTLNLCVIIVYKKIKLLVKVVKLPLLRYVI